MDYNICVCISIHAYTCKLVLHTPGFYSTWVYTCTVYMHIMYILQCHIFSHPCSYNACVELPLHVLPCIIYTHTYNVLSELFGPSAFFFELLHLNFSGVNVSIKGRGDVTCKARLLFALADLPAKAALYNITQFNGRFGCPSCKHEGQQVHTWVCPTFSLHHTL